MSCNFESEKNKYVYLMGQNYKKIKLEKYVLESNKVFQCLIREIEANLDEKCTLVIFLPDVEMEQIENLIKYVANESSIKLQEVNQELEKLFYKIKKVTGQEDPEEVIQNVDLPSSEWIEIVDDFIESEYPNLIVDITEKSLPDPTTNKTKYKSNAGALNQIKQRAFEWLTERMENDKFIGKFCLFSLIDQMLPGFESHSEQLTPTLIKYFMKWGDFEFSGIGPKLTNAKEDAAIYAIKCLLDLNLKTNLPLSKTKLINDIMPKIRLDKVSSRYYEETYQMSVKLPITGQVVRAQGTSLFNAKQKIFLLASKIVAVERRRTIEIANKNAFIEFYKAFSLKTIEKSPEIPVAAPPEIGSPNSILGPLDPNIIIREALKDVNYNEMHQDPDQSPICSPKDQLETLENHKRLGLERMKPFLNGLLYNCLTSVDILYKFLPNAVISHRKCVCTIHHNDKKWTFNGKSNKIAVENGVNSLLKKLFDIELVSRIFDDAELKSEGGYEVMTAKNGALWTSSLAKHGIVVSVSHKSLTRAKNRTIKSFLHKLRNKHEVEASLSNRISFAKLCIANTAPLVNRINFILDYFTVCKDSSQDFNGNLSFESTDWLLSDFEQILLLEINQNIHIQKENETVFLASICLNSEILTTTGSTFGGAKSLLILKTFEQVEKLKCENRFIVISSPKVGEHKEKGNTHTKISSEPVKIMSKRELIESYRKKAIELIYSDRFINQRKRGQSISASCILHNVIMPNKVNVIQELVLRPDKYEVTIEIAQKCVTGIGINKKEAKQDACRVAFSKILKINWDRASKGKKC